MMGKNKPISVGDIYKTKSCGDLEILQYINASEVKVRFIETGGLRTTTASFIRRGVVKDYYCRTVFGAGYYGYGKFTCKKNYVQTREYIRWSGVVERCYSEKLHLKRPTYKDCTLCDDWHDFQKFAEWFTNHPYLKEGCHVDKDILIKGNKHYSPETCVLIPHSINEALTFSDGARGKYPVGVSIKNGSRSVRYGSSMVKTLNSVKKKFHLGYYDTPDEAFLVYKKEKEKYIKYLADKHKDELDPRVYIALYDYKIEKEV